ncbi:hypothetical protein GCM10018965_090450 [Nonomuraea roseola]
MSAMEFRILGALDVIKDDRPLTVRSGKQQALLALLLCQAGKVVRSDALVDALWGDEAGEQGVKRLRLHLHRLRRTLGSAEAIVHRAQGYALDIPTGSLDAHRFESLAHQGRQALASGLVERASDLLHTALALWRGPALSGLEGPPLLNQEATRLNEERLSALGDCMDADLRLRRHTDLIGRLSVLVEEHPLQERFRGQLMLALYRAGRQAEALEVYRAGRHILSTDLGLEPGAELRRLELAILTSDASLAACTPTMRTVHTRRRRTRCPRC